MRSQGNCVACGVEYGAVKMKNHVRKCTALTARWTERAGAAAQPVPHFRLRIDGGGGYWLLVAARGDATLELLDWFLRKIWVECCGHCSQFTIAGRRYAAADDDDDGDAGNKETTTLRQALRTGVVFGYEYDYGTTTELRLTVVEEFAAPPLAGSVQLLARNRMPIETCVTCGKETATELCQECWMAGNPALFCDRCVGGHGCDEAMLVPWVNSPRTGQCGYTGPAEPAPSAILLAPAPAPSKRSAPSPRRKKRGGNQR